ncbi:enoyl-CoA hydratase-related protein [Caldisphaera lagunensis]|uniref:enoyl-CoA hydratase-related protein n=1 Tax=Caldisphaera lagunensis TaxID=200415 RepID=UPI000A984779|nr:enoyl-CoA hydratase-related protein [Caldisphaera lagunensis]
MENDKDAYVLILTGGFDAFSSGADLSDIKRLSKRVLSENGPLGITRINLSKPTISAISGYCVAGGFELALWTDIRIAEENAIFGFLERRFGVPLIDGGTQRLPLIVGLGRALDLILTGKTIDAEEAYKIGIVNYIVPRGKSLEKALELAETISSFPQETLRNDRKAVYMGIGNKLEDKLMIEALMGKKSIDNKGIDLNLVNQFLNRKNKVGNNNDYKS